MLKLIFNNNYFGVVDKPAGWLSVVARQPLEQNRAQPRRCVALELEQQLKQKILPVHRLDFEVSGIIMFALNAEAHQVANRWFEQRQAKKTYQAFTAVNEQFKINQFYSWHSRLLKGKKRTFEAEHGKEAETQAQVRATPSVGKNHYFEWELNPLTGRSHQLRYELAKRNMPILGDRLYGGITLPHESEIALRAIKIDFSECEHYEQFGLPASITVEPRKLTSYIL